MQRSCVILLNLIISFWLFISLSNQLCAVQYHAGAAIGTVRNADLIDSTPLPSICTSSPIKQVQSDVRKKSRKYAKTILSLQPQQYDFLLNLIQLALLQFFAIHHAYFSKFISFVFFLQSVF